MSMTSPNHNIGFVFTAHDGVFPYLLDPLRRELVDVLCKGMSVRQILEYLGMKNPEWDRDKVLHELAYLYENALLEPDIRIFNKDADPGDNRLDRQLNYLGIWSPEGRKEALEYQERLHKSRVAVIGIGGFGAHILLGLSYLSIGNITAVDFDRVQPSNLNRQILFDETHLGKRKIDAARERCRSINSRINFRFVDRKIKGPDDFIDVIKDADLAVLTADSPRQEIFSWMNQASFQTKTPVLYTLGVSPSSFNAGPLVIPGSTPCFECAIPPRVLDALKEPALSLNRRYRHATLEPYLMTGAGLMLNEIAVYLTRIRPCRLTGHMLVLNMHTYESRQHRIMPRKGCNYCGHLEEDIGP
jgi:bacteriocin biosynthesis cyclodehydratase domain-containing protein